MEALILICLVWLISLQITVNRLDKQINETSASKSPATPEQQTHLSEESSQTPPVPEPTSTVETAASSQPSQEPPAPAPEIDAPAEPIASESPSSSVEAPSATPAFEITAAKLFSWIGDSCYFWDVYGLLNMPWTTTSSARRYALR